MEKLSKILRNTTIVTAVAGTLFIIAGWAGGKALVGLGIISLLFYVPIAAIDRFVK